MDCVGERAVVNGVDPGIFLVLLSSINRRLCSYRVGVALLDTGPYRVFFLIIGGLCTQSPLPDRGIMLKMAVGTFSTTGRIARGWIAMNVKPF